MAETKNKGAKASEKLLNDLTSWFKNLSKKKNKKKKFDFNYDAQKARIKRLAESKNMTDLSAPEIKKAVKEKLTKTTDSGISSLSGVGTKRLNAKKQTDRQNSSSRSAPRTDLGDKEPTRFRTQRLRGLQQTVGQDPLGPSAGSKKKEDKKKEGMGGKATVSPNQKSRQATLPKEEGIGKQLARALSGGQKKTKVGNVTIDSTDEGMSKFLGTKDEIRQQMEDEEMNFRKGGAVKKKYGMREGGFTKRGGMYKKGY
jgi:hypothetical protein